MINTYNKGTQQGIRIISIVAVVMMMSACSALRPNARILNQVPAGAPVNYAEGWKDGCESGMAITGNQLYKATYKNRIDVQRVNDPQYYRGWNEAKVYCAHYTMAVQWEAGLLPQTPTEEKQVVPQTHGVFTVMASWGAPALFNFNDAPEAEDAPFTGSLSNNTETLFYW